MIRFDLSDIIEGSGVHPALESILSLGYDLELHASAYRIDAKNLTVGLKPTEGIPISKLPENDPTPSFIDNAMGYLGDAFDKNIEMIYSLDAFQVLIATGVISLGWLCKNDKYAKLTYQDLVESWTRIVLDSAPVNYADGPLYPHAKSFGLVARTISGHKNSDLVFFIIYDNQVDYNFLQNYLTENNVKNIILMNESEYAEALVNGMFYTFLVKFDRVQTNYSGLVFRAKKNLVEAVPTYLVRIGCDCSSVLSNESGEDSKNPHYKTKVLKKGVPVTVFISVPNNQRISLISLNGTTYFNGTDEMSAAGITVTETGTTTLTGYKTFTVTVSGLMNDADIFINVCDDLTGKQVTKSMISRLSSISIGEQDVSINLLFTRPFIYLDTSKIKVWAKKDENSELELVTATTFIADGQKYVKRKSVFSDPYHKPTYKDRDRMTPPPKPPRRDEVMRGENPYIHDNQKKHWFESEPKEPELASNVMFYNVTECGSVIITFDNYTDYKYFKVKFEDRAMIATFKVNGTDRYVDVIPVIESVQFTNEVIGDNTTGDDNEDNGTETPEVPSEGDGDTNNAPDSSGSETTPNPDANTDDSKEPSDE